MNAISRAFNQSPVHRTQIHLPTWAFLYRYKCPFDPEQTDMVRFVIMTFKTEIEVDAEAPGEELFHGIVVSLGLLTERKIRP